MVAETTKNWGDEDEEFLPCRTETTPDAEGIRTVVEYAFNAQGQKVRTTRRIQHTTKVIRTSKRILERRHWEKFGKALSEKSNTNVTYIADADITIEDPNSDMVQPGEKKEEESIFAGVKNSSIVACRHCVRLLMLFLGSFESLIFRYELHLNMNIYIYIYIYSSSLMYTS